MPKIKTECLKILDSKYLFRREKKAVIRQKLLQLPLNKIQAPVIVKKNNNDEYHVINGFSQALHLQKTGKKDLECSILPPDIDLLDIIIFIARRNQHIINSSLIYKAGFIDFAINLGLTEQQVTEKILNILELESHTGIITGCLMAMNLPENILNFCHKKNLSLKQCIQLKNYPDKILNYLDSLSEILSISASTFMEFTEKINDHLINKNLSLESFQNKPELKKIISKNCSANEKTVLFKNLLNQIRFPVLTEYNNKIRTLKKAMNLPGNIDCKWDHTLEKQELNFSIKINSITDWGISLQKLQSPSVKSNIKKIFEKL
ncbi:MAG: hypothetical protein GY730_03195 [bacterium]|nr:hypothetical protein [bacterium]